MVLPEHKEVSVPEKETWYANESMETVIVLEVCEPHGAPVTRTQ